MTAPDAGREMDAEVAERVMGYKRWMHKGNCRAFLRAPDWNPADHYTEIGLKILEEAPVSVPLFDDEPRTPKFSTDIAAAWTVVEKMRERGWRYRMEDDKHGFHWVFVAHHGMDTGYCDGCGAIADLPAAICRAALKAIEASDE